MRTRNPFPRPGDGQIQKRNPLRRAAHTVRAFPWLLFALALWLLAAPLPVHAYQAEGWEQTPEPSTPTVTPTPSPTATPTPMPLNWTPPDPRIQLEVRASSDGEMLIYTIYATNRTKEPVWDLAITVPLLDGASPISTSQPETFVVKSSDEAVTFFTSRFDAQKRSDPLILRLSTEDVTAPFAVVQVEASWKHVQEGLLRSTLVAESTRTGDIVVRPRATQRVVGDAIRDVPFASYDLTSAALQDDGSLLKFSLYLAGQMGPLGTPIDLYAYLDGDCNPETGKVRKGLGLDYRIRYSHRNGHAEISRWIPAPSTDSEEEQNKRKGRWEDIGSISVYRPQGGQTVDLWIPYALLDTGPFLCWLAESANRTDRYDQKLPIDRLPDGDNLTVATRYRVRNPASARLQTPPRSDSWVDYTSSTRPEDDEPVAARFSLDEIQGQLALPYGTGGGTGVAIVSLPGGKPTARIPDAWQPVFRKDGRRLLLKSMPEGDASREAGLFEYRLDTEEQVQITASSQDAHPDYGPAQGAIVLATAVPVSGADTSTARERLAIRCLPEETPSSGRPCQEVDPVRNVGDNGRTEPLWGSHPVWAEDGTIVFKGCNPLIQLDPCGLYAAEETQEPGVYQSVQLSKDVSGIPTDAQGELVVFMSQWTGDWEAYVMDVGGTWVRNLSNSPKSQDGLPALSPDGKWVAFLSDRGGEWAVWVVSVEGGGAQKLFDLAQPVPWQGEAASWTDHRISWAPAGQAPTANRGNSTP